MYSSAGVRHIISKSVSPQVLVSYSYFEKDDGQRDNLKYFMSAGMGIRESHATLPAETDFVITISGDACSPCRILFRRLNKRDITIEGVSAVWSMNGNTRLTILQRTENVGMDFAAHNVAYSSTNKESDDFASRNIFQNLCMWSVNE